MEKSSLQKVVFAPGKDWGLTLFNSPNYIEEMPSRSNFSIQRTKKKHNTSRSAPQKNKMFFFLGDLMIPDNSLSDLPPGMFFLPVKSDLQLKGYCWLREGIYPQPKPKMSPIFLGVLGGLLNFTQNV